MAEGNVNISKNDGELKRNEETRSSETFSRPPVNIIETENGITLMADIPGSSKDAINVSVDKGVLTISAGIDYKYSGTPVYSEFQLAPYHRQFSIPDSMDHEKAKAEYSNGIISLSIPKAAAAKPRKIEVTAA